MSENMDYGEQDEEILMNSAHSRGSPSSASAQDEEKLEEALVILLLESIATLTKLQAAITEMQVECVRGELVFSQQYNPKMLEDSREILDGSDDDPLEGLDEMDNSD